MGRSHASWRRGAISKMIPLVPSYRGEREIDAPGLSRCLGRHSAARTAARLGLLVLLVALAGTAAAVSVEAGGGPLCAKRKADAAYMDGVNETLAAHQDVWGNELLRSPDGPTYAGVRRYLHPLMLVGRPAGLGPSRLTDSGVYYLPFGRPERVERSEHGAAARRRREPDRLAAGERLAALARRRREWTRALRVVPRAAGDSRICAAAICRSSRRATSTRTAFATGRSRSPRASRARGRSSASCGCTSIRAGSEVRRAYVRFTPSGGLRAGRACAPRLQPGRNAAALIARLRHDTEAAAHGLRGLARPARADRNRSSLGSATYKRARRSVSAYWARRVAGAATFRVPERRVMNAERNLLIQNMLMSWRYSLGNSYERFSWELIDVAEVMGDYGFRGIERAILEASLHSHSYFPNRAAGERMAAAAHFYRRFRDRGYINRVTPLFRRYLDGLRAPARREPVRPPRQGALRRRHRPADLRPARPGPGASGAARDGAYVGADRAPAARRQVGGARLAARCRPRGRRCARRRRG